MDSLTDQLSKRVDFFEKHTATHAFVDVFFNRDDAYHWIQGHVDDHPTEEWEIIEERVNLLGGGYRAGIVFRKRQKELF